MSIYAPKELLGLEEPWSTIGANELHKRIDVLPPDYDEVRKALYALDRYLTALITLDAHAIEKIPEQLLVCWGLTCESIAGDLSTFDQYDFSVFEPWIPRVDPDIKSTPEMVDLFAQAWLYEVVRRNYSNTLGWIKEVLREHPEWDLVDQFISVCQKHWNKVEPNIGSGIIFSTGYIGRLKAKSFLDEVENHPAANEELKEKARQTRRSFLS